MVYEYRYRFWMDKSMIPRYINSDKLEPEIKFVLEHRTYFVVKRTDGGGDEIIDSERYDEFLEDESYLDWVRPDEYGMSSKEIDDYSQKATAFAKQKKADHPQLPFIPIAVELDVCTVQRTGEPISRTFDRAMRSEHLYPVCLFLDDPLYPVCLSLDDNKLLEYEWGLGVGKFLEFLRNGMYRDRVEHVDCEMVCSICNCKYNLGALMAATGDCYHWFHYHCILGWLLRENTKKSCPTCGLHISY